MRSSMATGVWHGCSVFSLPTPFPPTTLLKYNTSVGFLAPGSVDLVVTSPPYSGGKSYEQDLSLEEYSRFADQWVACVSRLLTSTGALWLNVGYIKVSETQAVPLTYLYYPLS